MSRTLRRSRCGRRSPSFSRSLSCSSSQLGREHLAGARPEATMEDTERPLDLAKCSRLRDKAIAAGYRGSRLARLSCPAASGWRAPQRLAQDSSPTEAPSSLTSWRTFIVIRAQPSAASDGSHLRSSMDGGGSSRGVAVRRASIERRRRVPAEDPHPGPPDGRGDLIFIFPSPSAKSHRCLGNKPRRRVRLRGRQPKRE